MKNKVFSGILKYCICFISVFLITIIGLSIFSNNKKIKITDIFNETKINNGFTEINYAKTSYIEDEQDYDTTNIVYKGYFDTNFENSGNLAVDGSFGLELESSKIGIYLPIQIIFNDDILFKTEIDEVYQTILEIPDNNTMMNAKLSPIISTIYSDFDGFDEKLFLEDLKKGLSIFAKNNSNRFYYTVDKEQFYIFTKGIGRFNINVTSEDFDSLDGIFKNVSGENSLNYKIFSKICNSFKNDYTLYIYVKNNQFYKAEIFNKKTSFSFEFKNININKELSFKTEDFEDYGLDFNEYLETHNSNFFALFGLNSDGSTNLQSLLRKHFKELMSYMYLCIEYSENDDSVNAQNYISLMNALIESIEEQSTTLSPKDMDLYNKYITVYKLLRQYTIIYNQQCFSSSEEEKQVLEDELFKTVEELTNVLNELGVDILADFTDGGLIDEEYVSDNEETENVEEVIDENDNEDSSETDSSITIIDSEE